MPNPPQIRDGSDMDYHDMAAIRAVDKFRREVRRFPTTTDIIRILRSMGWQPPKTEDKK